MSVAYDFKGRTVIVTGGARGQGYSHAQAFACAGAAVAVFDVAAAGRPTIPYPLADAAELSRAREALAEISERTLVCEVDVTDEAAVVGAVADVVGRFGGIDIVVNNAGVNSLYSYDELTVEAWREVLEVNLLGAFWVIRHAAPHLASSLEGAIVNIASMAALRGVPKQSHYAASKAGMIAMARCLAVELGVDGITVNTICPTLVHSQQTIGLSGAARSGPASRQPPRYPAGPCSARPMSPGWSCGSPHRRPGRSPERSSGSTWGPPCDGRGPPRGRSAVPGNFARLLTATAVTNAGDGIRMVAMPLLATTLTRDPVMIAAVTAAVRLPWLLASLPAGLLADRVDRRQLMGFGALGQATLVGALSLAVVLDMATIWLLMGVAFGMGCLEVVIDNTAQVITPHVVAGANLERANRALVGAFIVANEFLGPPIGGLLFAAAAAAPFGVDAVSFVVAAALLLSMAGTFTVDRSDRPAGSVRRDIGEGVRWLRGHRQLELLACASFAQNLFANMNLAILVLFALNVLDLSGAGFGLLVTGGSIGGLAATRWGGKVSGRLGVTTTLVAANLAMGVTKGGMGLVDHSMAAGALLAINGFAVVVWNVVTVTIRQRQIPPGLLGRVNSVYRLIVLGRYPDRGAGRGGGGRPVGFADAIPHRRCRHSRSDRRVGRPVGGAVDAGGSRGAGRRLLTPNVGHRRSPGSVSGVQAGSPPFMALTCGNTVMSTFDVSKMSAVGTMDGARH